ncbi:response regulator [Salinarimonas rosea]|uniref:response regulator n=1 Tax=Salinarimonas rosea TaxID=552063 RepID=UPI0004126FB1|nr:response regulator [Salinarimonas rosea]
MILVVDDEEELLEEIVEMLGRRGLPVVGESRPRAALDLLALHPEIDVVVTDWRMPGLDGLALMRAARGDPCARRDRRFFVMTGHEGDAGLAQALAAGAAGMLRKPFAPRDLIAALEDRAHET